MWFGSHFTVGVTRRLLLSSRVSLLVINLLTIRERVREKVRKETRDEINLRTDLFSSRTQVFTIEVFFTKFIPTTVERMKCTVGQFFLFKIKIFVLKMVTN